MARRRELDPTPTMGHLQVTLSANHQPEQLVFGAARRMMGFFLGSISEVTPPMAVHHSPQKGVGTLESQGTNGRKRLLPVSQPLLNRIIGVEHWRSSTNETPGRNSPH